LFILLHQVYRKVTQRFYRNHYGKITASFEQTLKLYFAAVKKWLGRGLGQCSRKVLILPCPFSCFRCVHYCVHFLAY